jgi:hypothetical protein
MTATVSATRDVLDAYRMVTEWLRSADAAFLTPHERAVIRDACDDTILATPGHDHMIDQALLLVNQLAVLERISPDARTSLPTHLRRLHPLRGPASDRDPARP